MQLSKFAQEYKTKGEELLASGLYNAKEFKYSIKRFLWPYGYFHPTLIQEYVISNISRDKLQNRLSKDTDYVLRYGMNEDYQHVLTEEGCVRDLEFVPNGTYVCVLRFADETLHLSYVKKQLEFVMYTYAPGGKLTTIFSTSTPFYDSCRLESELYFYKVAKMSGCIWFDYSENRADWQRGKKAPPLLVKREYSIHLTDQHGMVTSASGGYEAIL